jgi:hypothetical protein
LILFPQLMQRHKRHKQAPPINIQGVELKQ